MTPNFTTRCLDRPKERDSNTLFSEQHNKQPRGAASYGQCEMKITTAQDLDVQKQQLRINRANNPLRQMALNRGNLAAL